MGTKLRAKLRPSVTTTPPVEPGEIGAVTCTNWLPSGTIGGMDGQAYLRALLAREVAEGIAPAVVEEARQEMRAAITQRDVARLRAKGVLPRAGTPAQ